MNGNRVELVKGKSGWFLRFVSPNGKTLAVSESYHSKWGAKRAAKKNFTGIPMVEMEA